MGKTLYCHQKQFFEDYYGTLLKVAFRYAATYEQAVDITHHGFVRMFHEVKRQRIGHEVRCNGVLSARCKNIFISTLIDKIKSEINLHFPQPVPEDLWQHSGIRANLASEFIHIELIKILKRLPVMFRLVFNLHIIDGFSHAEIAKMLGITVKESKNNELKAKNLIEKQLDKL